MADTSGMADIRGIDIQKLAVAYSEEASVFKKLVTNTTTSAREIRWIQKSTGLISAPTTTGITTSGMDNTDFGALPIVAEQSWTRNTSYIRKYMVESPLIPMEDIDDAQIAVLAGNVRDLTLAVEYRVDSRIWDIMTESRTVVNINTNATTAAWDAASGQDPVEDILEAIQNLRTSTYEEVTGGYLLLSPKDHKTLLTWLITTKGSSIPQWSSRKVEDGSIQEILGLRVVVSTNVTADYALVCVPSKACVWYSFMPISTYIIDEPGIGKKIRVVEEGEAVLERPKFCNLITNTQT